MDPNDASGNEGRGGDPDNDGLPNIQEFSLRTPAGTQFENGTDPFDSDTDNDGLLDGFEFSSRNSQGAWLNPLDATGIHGGQGDPDDDGFSNLEEQELATDPWVANDQNPPDSGGPNVAPDDSALKAVISPEFPTLSNTLFCTPSGVFDPDGDEFEYQFQWYTRLPGPDDPGTDDDDPSTNDSITQADVDMRLAGWGSSHRWSHSIGV